jgi:hypothetical protein
MYAVLTLTITILALLYFIIQIPGTVVSSESKSLQQSQQNQSYIATLTGDNTSTTGVVKFITNSQYYSNNELYYEINLTNIHNEVVRIDIHLGKKGENGPAIVTLYQKSTFLPSEICCTSADSEYKRNKLFFNGTIFTQAFEFGPLAGSRNITDLVNLFDNGSAYVEVYTFNPDSLSLFNTEGEIRGQITK